MVGRTQAGNRRAIFTSSRTVQRARPWRRLTGFLILALVLGFAACSSGGSSGSSSSTGGSAVPSTPTVNPVTSPTAQATQTLTGTKDTNTAIFINGNVAVALDSSTTWSAAVTLSEGNNFLVVLAQNSAGVDSSTVTETITLDTTAPSAPTVNSNLITSPTNQSSVTLQGSRDGDAAIYIDGTLAANVANPQSQFWSATVTLTEGTNTFSVTAKDAVGNESTATSVTIDYDATAPTVTAVPASGSTVNSSSLSQITLTYSEPMSTYAANSGAYTFSPPQSVTVSQSGNTYTLTPGYAFYDGPLTLTIASNVTDLAGNAPASNTITYTVDNTDPTQTASPVSGSSLNALSSIAVTYSEAVTGADQAGNYALNGPGSGSLTVSSVGASGNTYTLNLSGTPGTGGVTLTISNITDTTGNALAGNTVSYTLDTTAPTVSADPASGATIGTLAGLPLTFSEAVTGNDTLSNFTLGGAGLGTLRISGLTSNTTSTTLLLDGVPDAGSVTLTLNGSNIKDAVGNGLSGGSFSYTAGSHWTTDSFTPTPVDIAWGNNTFVAVGAIGVAYTSTDGGTTWNRHQIGTRDEFDAVIYDGTHFVAVGGSELATSTDGTTWSLSTLPISDARNVVYYGGTYVVLGKLDDVATSADLSTWSTATLPTLMGLKYTTTGMTYGNGVFMVADGAGNIFTSADGSSWSLATTISGAAIGNPPDGMKALAYALVSTTPTFVYAPYGYQKAYVSTNNGSNWNGYNLPTSPLVQYPTAVMYDGTQFVAVSGSNSTALAYSTNGTSWVGHDQALNISAIVYDQSIYAAVTPYTSAYISVSGSITSPSWGGKLVRVAGLTDVAKGSSEYVAVAEGDVLSSTDGISWSFPGAHVYNASQVAFGNVGGSTPTYVVFSAGSGLYYTTNAGSAWTQGQSISSPINAVRDIAYGNSVFVATGTTTYWSSDGQSWTQVSPSTADFYGVASNGSLFVAVGSGGLVSTTTNGQSWTQQVSGTINDLTAVMWDGTDFIAVGASGTVITSTDGVNWTTQTSGFTARMNAIGGDGSHVYALGGAGGTTMVGSADHGATWTTENPGNYYNLSVVFSTGSKYVCAGTYGLVMEK